MSDWIEITEYTNTSFSEPSTSVSSGAIGSGATPSISLSTDYSLRTEDNEQLQFETGEVILLEPL